MIDTAKKAKIITLKQRTPEETKAYLEGFNNAYKTFRHELETQDSEMAAINIMELLVRTVNGAALRWAEEEDKDADSD